MTLPPRPGLETLLHERRDWIRGRRVGLVAHAASVGAAGRPAPELLREAADVRLVCLFGPEHGFGGAAGAGERVADARHPEWDLPVYSLYGATRAPTPEMLRGVEVILFDLQTLGCRAYTYIATLQLVLEAAARQGIAVVVCDRPVPLPAVVDGPALEPGCASFVGLLPAPLCFGMTAGETARWLVRELGLNVELHVARAQGFRRGVMTAWPEPWIPPSPAIRSLASAECFPMTVLLEALPALDHGRRSDRPFQRVGAPWLEPERMCAALEDQALPGVAFAPETYAAGGPSAVQLPGVRLRVTDPEAVLPVRTAVTLLAVLRDVYGHDRVWGDPRTRPDFFDRLAGARAVREALWRGAPPDAMAAAWAPGIASFRASREASLLY